MIVKGQKKDSIYSMRINSDVLNELRKRAWKDRRSVASLLEKIICDYLEREGTLMFPQFNQERRRYQRRKIDAHAELWVKKKKGINSVPVVIMNLSEAGLMITCPKSLLLKEIMEGDEWPNFNLLVKLASVNEQFYATCNARRMEMTSNQINIGASFKNLDEESKRILSANIM